MRKILIVDDSMILAKSAAAALEEMGHQVSFASNGQEALVAVEINRPDIIFLNAVMPGMDGWETCDALKSNKSTRGIPVLICTPDNSRANQEKVAQLGAAGFVIKPYKADEMLEKIREIFGDGNGRNA